jgi:prepilin-type N-terminal cleavage/methylation domain-containing protein
MIQTSSPSRGFTIIELLVVIVIIGILAAITIVAYNGIQGRAQAAAASSALAQVSKKIALYAIDNSAYPTDLATAGIANPSGTSYQYSVNNAVTPQTYCVTATNGTTSYQVSSASTTPTSGGCAGHGVGGVAAITNLVTNPSFETNVSGWANYTGFNAPTQVTTTPWSGSARLAAVGNNTAINPRVYYALPVTIGDTLSVSVRERSDGQVPTSLLFVIKTKLAGVENGTPVMLTPSWAPDASGWMQVSATVTIPANVDSIMIQPGLNVSSNYTGTFGVDGVIATKTASPANYADGSSANWVWNGTANASSSTGPAL